MNVLSPSSSESIDPNKKTNLQTKSKKSKNVLCSERPLVSNEKKKHLKN